MSIQNPFKQQQRVTLAGSQIPSASAIPAEIAAHANPDDAQESGDITVTVILAPKQEFDSAVFTQPDRRLRREQLAAEHGPTQESVDLLRSFAREFGLQIKQHPSAGARSFSLTGSQAALEEAFGTALSTRTINGETFRIREGALQIPEALQGHVQAVLGLDNRPVAKPHFCRRNAASAAGISYSPVQVAQLYDFPSGSAAGQTIGIIELGGGYREADLTAYFGQLGLTVPKVTAVAVDKGKNKPGKPTGADGEVMLDIEVAAAVAQGAAIVVYFAPNTNQGFTDAIATAVHDTTNKPSVISISWGGPESSWSESAAAALDAACQTAGAVGVSITVASGDNGSTDGVTTGGNHVDFPASSPHVLACGGTRLIGSGTTITSELVWNEQASNEGATGGGFSTLFDRPAWQNIGTVQGNSTGRGVPDVAGDADPETGYTIRVDGEDTVIGGTSAVAPLWAGLIALGNARNGHDAGFLNPTLYANAAAFHDITQGNNGAFEAQAGWDPCTGLGSPDGSALIQALAKAEQNALASH